MPTLSKVSKSGRKALRHIEQYLSKTPIGQDASRQCLKDDVHPFPQSSSLGMSVRRGYSVTAETEKHARILPQLHRLAKSRGSQAPYAAIQLSEMSEGSSLKLHRDRKNDVNVQNCVIATGTYRGGRLWYECPEGTHHPPKAICRTPEDEKLLGKFVDANATWFKFPARTVLHGVEPVTEGTRYSITLYAPSCLQKWKPELVKQMHDLGFPSYRCVGLIPPMTAAEKARKQALLEFDLDAISMRVEASARAVQELQTLPEDVDKVFADLAKSHPIALKAVRNAKGAELEKWKKSIKKEIDGLLDRDTFVEIDESSVDTSRIQSAPARMVFVIKPGLNDDQTRFVKRKSRIVICGNYLQQFGETSTANLDIAVFIRKYGHSTSVLECFHRT